MRSGTRFAGGMAAACALLAIGAASATAAVTRAPDALDFGDQAVGTTSAPKTVTITVGCTLEVLGEWREWPAYPYQEHLIWGLTERILSDFFSLLDRKET